jgi:hypothetical protein
VAADRYDIRRLKLTCEKKLCGHIGVGTAASNLARRTAWLRRAVEIKWQ